MQRIAGEIAAFLGTSPPPESRPGISVSESAHSGRSQFLSLQQLLIVTIFSKSPDPLEVNHDRSGRKTALTPHLDHGMFATVDHSHSIVHAMLDVSRTRKLSRRP